MFNLLDIFGKKKDFLTKEEIATILKTSPEALKKFEESYKINILDNPSESDNFFDINSRQMAEDMGAGVIDEDLEDTSSLVDRIVDEFLSETKVYTYTRKSDKDSRGVSIKSFDNLLPDKYVPVSNEDINKFELKNRPQCTKYLQKRDMPQDSCDILLNNLMNSKNPKLPMEKRRLYYNLFRQGLDILDIDPITYEIIGTNPISIGFWLPKIVDSVDNQGFFKIPSTTIIKVPMNILQLTRTDYPLITRTTLDIVDKFCFKAFNLKEDGDYFIKTGTYSSKFDFRNCRVNSPKEVRELGEYLLFIHSQACQMAGPLNTDGKGNSRSIYGVSTTNEWCVREYIEDKEDNPCIYKGLPLHTEYRVFVDFDNGQILSCENYWDPEMMTKRFAEGADRSVHDLHDYAIYKSFEDTLVKRFNDNKDKVISNLLEVIKDINLSGQWSIDIMQNGDEFFIIDMALAQNSAFYERIPKELKNPTPENWIPDLSSKI